MGSVFFFDKAALVFVIGARSGKKWWVGEVFPVDHQVAVEEFTSVIDVYSFQGKGEVVAYVFQCGCDTMPPFVPNGSEFCPATPNVGECQGPDEAAPGCASSMSYGVYFTPAAFRDFPELAS